MSSVVAWRSAPFAGGWYRAGDGVLTTAKSWDDSLLYTFDLTNALAPAGETLTGVAWTDVVGVTLSPPTLEPAATATQVTGCGEATLVLTTSAGRVLAERRRWRCTDPVRLDRPNDYGA